jgi:hypothetical protein
MEELYLYLSSSVYSKTGLPNTISVFSTSLPTEIRLDRAYDYEVALIKLIYPSTAYNIYEGSFSYYSYALETTNAASVPPGHYTSAQQFANEFNQALLETDREYYVLTVVRDHFRIECKRKDESTVSPYIEFSKNIQSFTGLPEIIDGEGITEGKTPWDPYGGCHNIYIYSDIVKSVNVGDTVAPLLAVTTYQNTEDHRQIEYEPKTPIYIPLSKDILDTVSVELRTKLGVRYPFSSGEVILVTHIKMQRPKL